MRSRGEICLVSRGVVTRKPRECKDEIEIKRVLDDEQERESQMQERIQKEMVPSDCGFNAGASTAVHLMVP